MKCTAWGMYPRVECNRFTLRQETNLDEIISNHKPLIPFGNGRSYGDSALSENIIDIAQRNYFIEFDENNGLLHVQAGVLLSEILEHLGLLEPDEEEEEEETRATGRSVFFIFW